MTSYLPSYCKNARQYPYIDRVSVGDEGNCVDFVYQFVKDSLAKYIIGTPTKFPNYGKFPKTFVVRNNGFDISISPWQNKRYVYYCPRNNNIKHVNFSIDIEFHEAVYPIRLSIYEIYNPGNIIKIHAKDSHNKWFQLWDRLPEIVPPTSRIFSPPLQCNFKTKNLKLEFKNTVWDYCTAIDAVMLIGTTELILPKNSEKSLTNILEEINCMHPHRENVNNLSANYPHLDIDHLQKHFSAYCIKSDIGKSFEIHFEQKSIKKISRYSLRLLNRYSNNAKRMKLSSDEHSEEHCYLSACPDEIILIILRNLDLISLCRIGQMNKRFYNLTRDPLLYTRLNVRNICNVKRAYIENIFSYFIPRCKYLKQLDLTFSHSSHLNFEIFLQNCGSHLTHLRLSKCKFVDKFVLLKISEICKNLKALDLGPSKRIGDKGLSFLENLESLEHLRLQELPNIKTRSICKILQKNRRMRELILRFIDVDLDAVAVELGKFCQNLEIVNFEWSSFITLRGISALADCKNLREVNLRSQSDVIVDDSLNKLFSSCQHLKEICLYNMVLTDDNLQVLTQCKNLEQLCLNEVKVKEPERYSILFEQCPKLQEFHFKHCKISSSMARRWKERYPHVVIEELYRRRFELIVFPQLEAHGREKDIINESDGELQ